MGGKIRVVYRQEDGTVHTRDRWTNRLGHYLKSHRIAEREHDWMMRYFSPAERMDRHKEKEDTHLAVSPSGYGIVVVDFMANQLLAVQNYTSIDRISPAEATGEFYRPESREEAIRNFIEMPDHRLHVRRRVFTTFQQNTTFEDVHEDPLTQAEAHTMARVLMREYMEQNNIFRERVDTMITPEKHIQSDFLIDFSPLDTLLNSDDDATSLVLVRDRMVATGFVFTPGEAKAWDQEITKALNRNY